MASSWPAVHHECAQCVTGSHPCSRFTSVFEFMVLSLSALPWRLHSQCWHQNIQPRRTTHHMSLKITEVALGHLLILWPLTLSKLWTSTGTDDSKLKITSDEWGIINVEGFGLAAGGTPSHRRRGQRILLHFLILLHTTEKERKTCSTH